MTDITNAEINVGDLLICTDYSSTGLYYGVVIKITKASVTIRQLLDFVSEEELTSGKIGYETRKSSASHMFIVRDESSIASIPVEVYADDVLDPDRDATMGELIQAVRNHVR